MSVLTISDELIKLFGRNNFVTGFHPWNNSESRGGTPLGLSHGSIAPCPKVRGCTPPHGNLSETEVIKRELNMDSRL